MRGTIDLGLMKAGRSLGKQAADSPFQLTDWRERFKLRLKLLRTPTRRVLTRFRDFIRRIRYQGDRHISPKSPSP